MLAEATGLPKSAAQTALALLRRGELIATTSEHAVPVTNKTSSTGTWYGYCTDSPVETRTRQILE